MDAPNFSNILNQQSTDFGRPKPLPVGHYLCVNPTLPRFDKSTKKGTPFAEFTLKFLSAEDDVDEEALAAVLTKPSGEKTDLTQKSIRATFYLTEDAVWRLGKFLDDLGIDEEGSFQQRIDQSPGCQVRVQIKHRPSEDGESVFAEIANTYPVE